MQAHDASAEHVDGEDVDGPPSGAVARNPGWPLTRTAPRRTSRSTAVDEKPARARATRSAPIIGRGMDRAMPPPSPTSTTSAASSATRPAMSPYARLRLTNRLRTEGTDHLLTAARAAGVRRVMVQSFTGWPYARTGGPVKTEQDALDPSPPAQLRGTLNAICHLEAAVTAASGVVLRYGGFTARVPAWPGRRAMGDDPGAQVPDRRRRRRRVVVHPHRGRGRGDGRRARALDARADLQRGRRRSVPVRKWLPVLAEVIGVKPPRRLPRWAGRMAGAHVVALLCESRGASNKKACSELGGIPACLSWRQGFAELARSVHGA